MSCLPILLYHHVAPDREVTPEAFEAQLAWLKAQGYRSLSGSELLDHMTGRKPAEPRSLMLTFDDGYADNWVYAFPILKSFGFKATIFIVTGRLSRGRPSRLRSDEGGALADTRSQERGAEGFLDWSEARIMAQSGFVEFGSHTQTHKGFVAEAAYEDLPGELERSRKTIEAELEAPCFQLAWPWGRYEPDWPQLAERAGYSLVHTTQPGANVPGGDALRLARFKVQNGSLSWLRRRLAIYSRPWAARLYGGLYGLDRRFRSFF